jgi:hypothetical protein
MSVTNQRRSLRAVLVFLAAWGVVLGSSVPASAQSERRPVEVSAVLSGLEFNRFAPLRDLIASVNTNADTSKPWLEPALGARLTYHFGPHVGVDWETNVFFEDPRGLVYVDQRGGRKTQLLVGPIIGRPIKFVEVYGTLRAGLMSFRRLPAKQAIQDEPGPISAYDFAATTSAIVDVGGLVYWRPSKRTALRLDVHNVTIAYRPVPHVINTPYTTHSLQISASVGLRFASR